MTDSTTITLDARTIEYEGHAIAVLPLLDGEWTANIYESGGDEVYCKITRASFGETIERAIAMIDEALELHQENEPFETRRNRAFGDGAA